MSNPRAPYALGSPRKSEEVGLPKLPIRLPDEGQGDLFVAGKDPDWEYYWELDVSEDGPRIFRALNRGWEFATTDDALEIGSYFEHETKNVGSVYRVPESRNGSTMYHYLLKIPKEMAEAYRRRDEERLLKKERHAFTPDRSDGQYGETGYEVPGLTR